MAAADDFKQASHAIWQAMAATWDARHTDFEETARPVTERMIERLDPAPGEDLLDLAAGTGVAGFATAALVQPGGTVLLGDFSAAMVDAARRHAERLGLGNVGARVLDAEQLDLPDGAVDGVLCRWGYMLMPDPAVALAETRRVLKPGGRLSCAVFGAPEDNPWAAVPAGILQERGHLPPPAAGAPGILALGDVARLAGLITGAGFGDPAIEDVGFRWRFAGMDAYWEFLTSAAGALAMVIERLGPREREAVRAEVAGRVDPYGRDGGLELPAVCLVAAAAAP